MKRTTILTAAVALAALAGPGQVIAGTATASGPQVGFTAAAGESNRLTISQSGTSIVYTDTGAPVTAGVGCTPVSANSASCALPPSASAVYAQLGDGNDEAVVAGSVSATAGFAVSLYGEAGNDTLTGGATEDSLNGGDGNDTMAGNGGQDGFPGGAGADRMVGGDGDDLYYGLDEGIDVIDGGDGDDTVTTAGTADGADTINLGPGFDRIDFRQRSAPLTLTADGVADDGQAGEGDNLGADVEDITGGSAADRIVGMQSGARTSLNGDRGNDTLTGGPGGGSLTGREGDDTLIGGPGAEFIEVGTGADTVNAGAGDDEIQVVTLDAEADDVHGGQGTDRLSFPFGTTGGVTVSLDGVADDGMAGQANNVHSDVEDVSGTRFADTLTGNGSPNQLDGGDGNDTITGFGGADGLVGGRGDDAVDAGPGVDIVDGGSGADRLVSRDRSADEVVCGGSVDTVVADRLDTMRACETISTGVVVARASARNVGGRVRITLSCPVAETPGCTGTLRLTQRGIVGRRGFSMPAGATRTVTVKLARRTIRGPVTATATFTDAAGFATTTTRRITVGR